MSFDSLGARADGKIFSDMARELSVGIEGNSIDGLKYYCCVELRRLRQLQRRLSHFLLSWPAQRAAEKAAEEQTRVQQGTCINQLSHMSGQIFSG